MKTQKETQDQPKSEVVELRLRVKELEASQEERKRVESELEDANKQIATILESITDAFFALDRGWRFNYLNKEAERVLQRKREDLIGKNLWEEFPEAVDSAFYREYHRAMSEQTSVEFEEFYPPYNIWVEVHAYPFEQGLSVYFEDISGRKRAEEFRTQLVTILEATSDFVSTADVQGHVQYFNSAAKRMLGIAEDEDTSSFMIRDVHPEWATRLILGEGVPAAMREGIWEGETAILNRGGREIPVSQVILAHKRPDGTVGFLSTIARDITERKRAEGELKKARDELELRVKERTEELARANEQLRSDIVGRGRIEESLRESEVRFRALSEASFEAIVIHEQGIALEVNQVYTRIFGYEPSELIGKYILDFVLAPESREVVAEYIRRGLEAYEAVALKKDGTTFQIEVHAKPMIYQGRHVRVAAIRDVTERKRAEEALRASEEKYRSIVETAQEGIWIRDVEGQTTFVNSKMAEMLGYTVEEMIGKPIFVFLDEEWQAILATHMKLRGQGVSEQFDFKFRRKDGTEMWALVSANPTRDMEGRYAGALGMVTDITDRKRVEQLREEYVSLISHDLRAPLTVIQGQADLLHRLLAQQGLEREAHGLESILKSAKRMNAMIQDLVESARLESGQLEMHKEPTDLPSLISDIVERVGTIEDRARIQVESPALVPPASVDRERIERVIVNLITNALKYSPPNTPVLVQIAPGDGEAIVSVTDLGTGIPPEDMPHLFQRFYRAKTGKKAEGLGLGLYIARLIVEAHGGRIWAESQVGKGSTFDLSLPFL